MIERIINCLRNDYDGFIVVGIAVLAGLFMVIYHKYEKEEERDKNTRPSIVDIHFAGKLYGIFSVFIILCAIYLFFRFAGVLPNQLSSHP